MKKVLRPMSKSLFSTLRVSLARFQKARTAAYLSSQEALRNSKRAILAIHRDDWGTAVVSLATAEKQLLKIQKLSHTQPHIRFDGAVRAAMEEYVEARLYLGVVRDGSVEPIRNVRPTEEEYVGGLADLTGELVRRSVALATNRRTEDVAKVRDIVRDIVEHLLELHLTGFLRQKFDDAKRNLHRVEDIYYQLTLR